MSAQASLAPVETRSAEPAHGTATDRVAIRLEHFQVIPTRWVRLVLTWLPAAIILWCIGGLLRLPTGGQPDYFLLTAFLAVVIDLYLLRYLFDHTPQVLLTLWLRHLCESKAAERPVEKEFLAYLKRFERALSHPLMHVVGVIFAILAIGSTYVVLAALQSGQGIFNAGVWERLITGLRILYLPVGYFVGLMTWKACVIAYFINRLGEQFELKIQSNHPDQCGGLKPLGNLCLVIALLLLVPSIYYSIWGFITAITQNPSLAVFNTWATPFRIILFVLILTSLLLFFQPLQSIHQQMARRRQEIQNELDRLSQIMDETMLTLRLQAPLLTPQEGAQKLDALKFMQQVYAENQIIPTWPFEWKILLRYFSAQAIPLLSLIGTSGPLVQTIQTLVKSLGG